MVIHLHKVLTDGLHGYLCIENSLTKAQLAFSNNFFGKAEHQHHVIFLDLSLPRNSFCEEVIALLIA
jgi:exopolysaccharide biosynthesis predicted pyruvyltransferase EpsI